MASPWSNWSSLPDSVRSWLHTLRRQISDGQDAGDPHRVAPQEPHVRDRILLSLIREATIAVEIVDLETCDEMSHFCCCWKTPEDQTEPDIAAEYKAAPREMILNPVTYPNPPVGASPTVPLRKSRLPDILQRISELSEHSDHFDLTPLAADISRLSTGSHWLLPLFRNSDCPLSVCAKEVRLGAERVTWPWLKDIVDLRKADVGVAVCIDEPYHILACASEASVCNDAVIMRSDNSQWFTSTDTEGRIYFYEENTNESVWMLPTIQSTYAQDIPQMVYYPEGSKLSPAFAAEKTTKVSAPARPKLFKESKAERASKARSMVLTTSSGTLANISAPEPAAALIAAKTCSLPRYIPQWPSLQAGSIVSEYITNLDTRVIRQGILQRTKLTENGKKLRKNWSSSFVVLTDLFLLLFKDVSSKSSSSNSGNDKPELCVDMNGAYVEWASEKSSRKNVFQVTTLLGLQLLLQDEDSTSALIWFDAIRSAIQALPCGLQGSSPSKGANEEKASPGTPTRTFLAPPSPDDSAVFREESSTKFKISRKKSTKARVFILGSTEDLTAAEVNPGDRQIKLRDKLRKFFVRRPTVDSLVKKGIYKDEPVFGCRLFNLCQAEGTKVPRFVQQVIEIIESKPENMKTDGLYRASGNLSQVQKIRLQVDQNNWSVLELEEDVHVLTGALKLFFRELKEPLIPYPLFERALRASSIMSKPEKIQQFRDIIKELPSENYQTLHFLLKHLLRVTEYREHNRMHISNLAIVFGPTLLWPATESVNIALDMMQQNLVVEALLNNFIAIFR